MAWGPSKMFRAYLADTVAKNSTIDLDNGSFKAALFNATPTPDQNAPSAAVAYNLGVWVTANEVSQAGQWAAGGVALTGLAGSVNAGTAGVVFWLPANTASGSAATLTNATGTLVYESVIGTPVVAPGVCYNYFGGSNSVVNGTFTVLWSVLGVWRATM